MQRKALPNYIYCLSSFCNKYFCFVERLKREWIQIYVFIAQWIMENLENLLPQWQWCFELLFLISLLWVRIVLLHLPLLLYPLSLLTTGLLPATANLTAKLSGSSEHWNSEQNYKTDQDTEINNRIIRLIRTLKFRALSIIIASSATLSSNGDVNGRFGNVKML